METAETNRQNGNGMIDFILRRLSVGLLDNLSDDMRKSRIMRHGGKMVLKGSCAMQPAYKRTGRCGWFA
jgi:hypothetical protein